MGVPVSARPVEDEYQYTRHDHEHGDGSHRCEAYRQPRNALVAPF
jgi:hypothetical protein